MILLWAACGGGDGSDDAASTTPPRTASTRCTWDSLAPCWPAASMRWHVDSSTSAQPPRRPQRRAPRTRHLDRGPRPGGLRTREPGQDDRLTGPIRPDEALSRNVHGGAFAD